jgi:acetyl-CoA synthetase
VGRPGPGFDVRIVDPETGRPTVEPGEIGEIAVRYENNPICFTEYWHRPEATEAKVQNGWLLTEDLGAMDDDGYVTFKSRKDDVIISAGYRIGPEEVEECIADHPKIADSAVIGVPDQERGEVPKAFVILTEGETADGISQQVKQHVKDRLAKYEYPREIEIVADLPKTTTGKVDRSALKDREGLGD